MVDKPAKNTSFGYLAVASFVLAYGVVILGAFVRLSDAGLGCPDWPGCYGHLMGIPDAGHEIVQANQTFPERAVEAGKAWKEMIHRYLAGTLGLLILGLAAMGFRNRRDPAQAVGLPLVLLALVIFQALLGMWTVTLQLKPVIVMAHLLGGLATLSLLWWLVIRETGWCPGGPGGRAATLGFWAGTGLLIVIVQIALGGWTSSNYAALACPDFPTCQGRWWPTMDFGEAFVLWRGLGVNYEFGVLEHPARTAIHMVHRIGAVVTAAYLLWLGLRLVRSSRSGSALRTIGLTLLAVLAVQVTLGVSNVVYHLPLAVAVAHNGVAALLLLTVVTLIYVLGCPRTPAASG